LSFVDCEIVPDDIIIKITDEVGLENGEKPLAKTTAVYYCLDGIPRQGILINGVIISRINLTNNQVDLTIALLQIWGSSSRYGNEEVSQHVMQILLKLFADMRSIVDFIKNRSDLL